MLVDEVCVVIEGILIALTKCCCMVREYTYDYCTPQPEVIKALHKRATICYTGFGLYREFEQNINKTGLCGHSPCSCPLLT